MVRDELLAQTADPSRVSVEGTHVTLAPKAAEVLTLAIHELATNAAKYGAIRAPAGEIAVHWRREQRDGQDWLERSEEHTSELQSLMRISYAVFCLKKKKNIHHRAANRTTTQQNR